MSQKVEVLETARFTEFKLTKLGHMIQTKLNEQQKIKATYNTELNEGTQNLKMLA